MKRIDKCIIALIAMIALSMTHVVHAATPINLYQGNWNANVTYQAGNVVNYNNATYLSLVSKNKSKTPGSSGSETSWLLFGAQSDVASLQSQVATMQTQLSELQSSNTTLTQQVSTMQTTINTQQTTIASLQTQNTTLTNQVTALQSNDVAGVGSVMSYDANTKTVLFSGVNVQIVNGLNNTLSKNGLGNLLIGYNERMPQNPYCNYYQNTKDRDQCENSGHTWINEFWTGSHNLVMGWYNNYISSASIIGGEGNTLAGDLAGAIGGVFNFSAARGNVIAAGAFNAVATTADNSAIIGGHENLVAGQESVILAGNSNKTHVGGQQLVAGGSGNNAYAGGIILGGMDNTAKLLGIVIGGQANNAETYSLILSGLNNKATGYRSILLGGDENVTTGIASSVIGGTGNQANNFKSTVMGGLWNKSNADDSLIVGGRSNETYGYSSSTIGGDNNKAIGGFSSIAGGTNNITNGDWSSISGGNGITVDTNYGWAAGTAPNTFSAP